MSKNNRIRIFSGEELREKGINEYWYNKVLKRYVISYLREVKGISCGKKLVDEMGVSLWDKLVMWTMEDEDVHKEMIEGKIREYGFESESEWLEDIIGRIVVWKDNRDFVEMLERNERERSEGIDWVDWEWRVSGEEMGEIMGEKRRWGIKCEKKEDVGGVYVGNGNENGNGNGNGEESFGSVENGCIWNVEGIGGSKYRRDVVEFRLDKRRDVREWELRDWDLIRLGMCLERVRQEMFEMKGKGDWERIWWYEWEKVKDGIYESWGVEKGVRVGFRGE